ncbi:hypothetical protein EYZ11_012140 [Aspergillus tanneri]|uniref:Uncharacterized protein n=1 Tax=Aspergillus tanneri TaxID=1220188 RepID=A0A4S3J106_9EURO|nr:hypothetical protein EYZ11_012140 [Aspergillus tanneri]
MQYSYYKDGCYEDKALCVIADLLESTMNDFLREVLIDIRDLGRQAERGQVTSLRVT